MEVDNMEIVTCWYCDNYEVLFRYQNRDFVNCEWGICHLKEDCILGKEDICDKFELRQGLCTLKWFPGKKGKWR